MRRVFLFPAILLLVGATVFSAAPAGAQQQVAVSLNDPPFEVIANPSSVTAGAVDFQVSNDSQIFFHNLRVIRTDLAPDALPVSGFQVDEAQVNVVASSQDLAKGATETVSANLAAGNYVLICNIPNHYGAGQFTAFTVTGAQEPVGGIAELPEVAGRPLEAPGSSGSSAGVLTGIVAGLAVTGAALAGLAVVAYRRRWRGE
jgi:uncharacterized cupredoxin-like copper-binding protein